MGLLIKGARILDPTSPYNNQAVDIAIGENGNITAIGKLENVSDQVINAEGCLATVGWVDMHAHFNDPGLEHKEDIASGMHAAQAGGFTDVAVLPNTKPVVQTKNDVTYLLRRAERFLAKIHPIAAVTIGTKGEELTEIIDLHHAGAVAFSDGEHPVWHTDILIKSLTYLQHIDGLLINKPVDKWLTAFGVMNEGETSTLYGMKGMPALAEEIMIRRDLMLLEYAGGKIHFSGISAAGSVALIREAKTKGLKVTCDVPVYNLVLEDNLISDFDTNYKVSPPLRTNADRMALVEGLKDGTIDAIASYHTPHDTESKRLEFDLADFGMISLQTFLPNILACQEHLPIEKALAAFTTNPRTILKLPQHSISVGQAANITLFDPTAEWVFDSATNRSKSINSPWYGQKLKGRVKAVVVGDRYAENF